MAHMPGISETHRDREELGFTVSTENENFFNLRGRHATPGGKPNLIALRGNAGAIIDVETGSPARRMRCR